MRCQIDRPGRVDAAGALRQFVVERPFLVSQANRAELKNRFDRIRRQPRRPGKCARFASSTSATVPETTPAAMLVPLSDR